MKTWDIKSKSKWSCLLLKEDHQCNTPETCIKGPVLHNISTDDVEMEVSRKLTDDLKLLIVLRIKTYCEEMQKYYTSLRD